MSEVTISTGHPDAGRIYAEALDQVTAERDAGLAREAALAQNLKYAEQGYLSIAESADASAQTLHEVISRLKAERDAMQALLTAADERADELERDAARYRWLRDPDNRDDLEPEDILVVGIAEGEDIVWLEQMDQAIDANLESLNSAGGGGHD